MSKNIFLHIGTHKTGSSSIQKYLQDHKDELDVSFYQGMHNPSNHAELHASAMRDERKSPFKEKSGFLIDQDYRERVKEKINSFIEDCENENVVFTAEGLSYLRYQDEVRFLVDLFKGYHVTVIVYLRNKDSFIQSYSNHINRSGESTSEDKDSYNFVSDNTWLTDYETLLNVYSNGFGEDSVVVLDYDKLVEQEGTVIPAFLKLLNIPVNDDVNLYKENQNEDKERDAESRLKHVLGISNESAEIYREIALFLEQHELIEPAKKMMDKARYRRPKGPFIKEKCQEYKRLLQKHS